MVQIRKLAVAIAVAVAVVALHAAAARAQALQRLFVDSLTLSSDAGRPQLEIPFHLVVSLHVRQRVPEIENLELPILAELELLGDERRLASDTGGTQYRETITVVAHHSGEITIAPVALQAIDARDGRPKQFFSNGLTLQVSGGALEPLQRGESFAAHVLRLLLRAAIWVGGILCVIAVVALLFRRRPPSLAPPQPAAPPPPPRPVVVRSRREQLQDALTVLRAERSRASAVRVRSVVWRMVGASDGETLGDVLQRTDAADPQMRALLRSLERAAFTYDEDLQPAIDDACSALERYVA